MLLALRHNFGYKLLALFFAVVLHFYVAGLTNARPPHILILPLSARNLPPGLILDAADLPSVTLTLDGSTEEINRLTDTTVTAWVDLAHAQVGDTSLLPVHVAGLPPSVTVENEPPPISLQIEERRRRQLKIGADNIGIAPAGYSFPSPVITPREAVISGTREAVGSVVRLVAQADPDQSAGAVDEDFTLAALDAAGSPVGDVTITPPTAHIRLDLVRAVSRKTLIVSADVVGSLAAPYRFGNIEVSPATVTAEGRPNQLVSIGTLTTAPIDVTGATKDIVRRVEPIVPAGVALSPSGPITVTIHVIAPPAPMSATPPVTAPFSSPTEPR
ncbi:MAG: CdaR family protein [Janthinobacterium lividum]